MREYHSKDLTLLGKGGTGSVYRINDEQVLKTYSSSISPEELMKKREAIKQLLVKDVPAMFSFEVARIDDSYGIVYEMLKDSTVAKSIMKDASCLEEMGVKMGKLFRQMHNADVSDCLPPFHERIMGWVDSAEETGFITKHCAKTMRTLIGIIPEGHALIHSDFHEGNVKVLKGELLLIDLDEIAYGNPLYDLAFHYNNHIAISKAADVCLKSVGMLPQYCKKIYEIELNAYFDGNIEAGLNKKLKPISLMLSALAVVRLNTDYLDNKLFLFIAKQMAVYFDIYTSCLLKLHPNIYGEK